LTTAPEDKPLGEGIGSGIHHFLLPSQGWGAVIDTSEAKTYAPDKREELRLWRNGIRGNPSAAIKKRLAALAQRVETLWEFTLRRLTIAEAEIRRDIDIWGFESDEPPTAGVTREQIEAVLYDENGGYRRLRRVMDAWCALWSWPLTTDIEPPDWDQWIGGLEAILGVPPKAGKLEKYGQMSMASDLNWRELDFAEENDQIFSQAVSIEKALNGFPWLRVAQSISESQGFFHWELDFAPVFARGGFDLQVGNPPWVRPDWDEAGVLAEFDPWWQLADKASEADKQSKRDQALSATNALGVLLSERAGQAGLTEHFGSEVDRPVLSGLRTDLYRCFMERTWRSMARQGIIALIHPESHFTEARANALRRETYRRLRRHWQFQNEAHLFEIHHSKEYGVHVYGREGSIRFLQGASLYHPDTVIRSFDHDGSGPAPGVKDDDGGWDRRPHAARIIEVTESQLSSWGALIDEGQTSASEARLLYPVNRSSAGVLDKIAAADRIGDVAPYWTTGWDETASRKAGILRSASSRPSDWADVVLQGPHLTVGNPLYKEPNETMRNNLDTQEIILESIDEDFIPRTSYQPAVERKVYSASYPRWGDSPSSDFFRLAWRRMTQNALSRSLHVSIIPPGPCHTSSIVTMAFDEAIQLVRSS
ncbi:MAG: class I SAM-dependent DNA methyltransferase, partial [Verrucomicrobiota bacterium]